MTIFSKMIEDPFYDEDGILVDEDAEWQDVEELIENGEISFDPFETVNS